MDRIYRFRRLALAGLLTFAFVACDDTGVDAVADRSVEVGVVVNSVDVSLTIFPVDSAAVVRPPIGLGPAGSPTGLSVRGEIAAVPLGFVPAVAVVNIAAGELLRTVALPENSGATGSAFVNDSIVLVANSNLNSVTPVNVLAGTTRPEIPVGGFPQAVLATEEGIVVLNAELGPDFRPARPATVSVVDAEALTVDATIELSGTNAGSAVVGLDGLLYVVNSGTFGAGDGSLSVVDLAAREEVAHHEGFGDFPVDSAFGPAGRLHISSFSFGAAIWDPATEAFLRSPDDAVEPEGTPSVAGLGFDSEGRLYTLRPDCVAPSVAARLTVSFAVELAFPVGVCPLAIAFVDVGD